MVQATAASHFPHDFNFHAKLIKSIQNEGTMTSGLNSFCQKTTHQNAEGVYCWLHGHDLGGTQVRLVTVQMSKWCTEAVF